MPFRKSTIARVKHLRGQYAETLAILGHQQDTDDRRLRTLDGVFDYVVAFDPTPKAVYLQKIIRWLIKGTIRLEDGRRVRTILERFHADKRKLPEAYRDIGQYCSPSDVLKALGLQTQAIADAMPDTVRAASPMLAGDDHWQIRRVEDVKAAQWWAKPTQWCTRSAGTAARYLESGPLYVLVLGEDRLQFHLPTRQFMDADDIPVNDLSFLPSDALETILDIDEQKSSPEIPFRRTGPGFLAEREFLVRDGKLPPTGLPWMAGEDWATLDSKKGIALSRSALGFRYYQVAAIAAMTGRQQPVLSVRVDGAGRHDVRLEDMDAGERRKPEHVAVMVQFLRSGATRLADGLQKDGVHSITGNNELLYLLRHLDPDDMVELVVSNTRAYLVQVERQDDFIDRVIVRDLHDEGATYRFAEPKDLERAPRDVEAALRVYYASRALSPGVLMALGASAIGLVPDDKVRFEELKEAFWNGLSAYDGLGVPEMAREIAECLAIDFGVLEEEYDPLSASSHGG